ncbi:FHA domain-containing protein [Stratiformator vulcanicus]|uniref:Glycogen accumulation regulator GarA n=1 Tax=Stratiformator vulcanicus TaxID=2527980 RepID=A0A517R1J8_9PLAN|nr:FHA domain-containing protein [Stratiformator vulcanicus]QDT37748.1 Glycogen accumulation regulator GarA [Stratiformator vulcanicus]
MKHYLIPQPNGKPILLNRAVILIGRHPDCDISVGESERVSRRHCCVVQVNETFLIRDLGSTNGVRVNGRHVDREETLEQGDEITVGDSRFVFAGGQPNADGKGMKQFKQTLATSDDAGDVEDFSGEVEVLED